MDMMKYTSMNELSNEELFGVEGGLGPIFWTCVGVVAGFAVDGVIITTTGKSGGEWAAAGIKTGLGWVKSWF